MHAGLFHTRNFAQMEGKTQFKSNSKQVPEDCCQRQNKATGTFLQVSSVQVYLIQRPHCSFFKHTSIQSAHTHKDAKYAHTPTQCYTHTQAIVDEPWEKEKSITVMIDFAAGWADLERLCFPSTQRAKSQEVGGFTNLFIQSKSPHWPTNHTHAVMSVWNTPNSPQWGNGKGARLTLDNVTSAPRKLCCWKMWSALIIHHWILLHC